MGIVHATIDIIIVVVVIDDVAVSFVSARIPYNILLLF